MDHFTRLADDLLVHILSFLPIGDAAATSVLSTRWRYLWKLTRRINITSDFLDSEEHDVGRLRRMKSVLSSFDDPISFPVDKITIKDSRDYADFTPVEGWISFALDRHNVEEFSLSLFVWQRKCRFPTLSSEPRNYRLMHLHLEYVQLPPNFPAFRNLRSLALYGCLVPDSAFATIERNCTLLERLNLFDTRGLQNLRISGNLCYLSHLSIVWFQGLKLLVIDSPNLVFLEYAGMCPAAGHRIRAPRLKEAELRLHSKNGDSSLALIQSITGEIEMLKLQIELDLGQHTELSRYRPLSNVKELSLVVLSGDLAGLDALLRVSLGLKRLCLLFDFSLRYLLVVPLAGFKHPNLKKIRIVRVSRRPDHLLLLRYLIDVADQLDEMEIVLKGNAAAVARNEKYIKRGIEDKLPYGAKLVIQRNCRR